MTAVLKNIKQAVRQLSTLSPFIGGWSDSPPCGVPWMDDRNRKSY